MRALRAIMLAIGLLVHGALWGTVGVDLVGWQVAAVGSLVGGGVIGWYATWWIG